MVRSSEDKPPSVRAWSPAECRGRRGVAKASRRLVRARLWGKICRIGNGL